MMRSNRRRDRNKGKKRRAYTLRKYGVGRAGKRI